MYYRSVGCYALVTRAVGDSAYAKFKCCTKPFVWRQTARGKCPDEISLDVPLDCLRQRRQMPTVFTCITWKTGQSSDGKCQYYKKQRACVTKEWKVIWGGSSSKWHQQTSSNEEDTHVVRTVLRCCTTSTTLHIIWTSQHLYHDKPWTHLTCTIYILSSKASTTHYTQMYEF